MMSKRLPLLLLTLLLAVGSISAQRYAKISVGFYNLENLFDTQDGPNDDAEYLPNGANHWTPDKYQKKLHNMARAISELVAGKSPDILGVCEVENRGVLEDLLAQPELRDLGYGIAHFESPDRRGIDCGLLYRKSIFKLSDSQPHRVRIPKEDYILTRDVLEVDGSIGGEHFTFLVAHWPSRLGGEQVSLNRRMAAARVMRSVVDSVQGVDPARKFVLMGDFNDDPTSPSVLEGLRSKIKIESLEAGDLFNPMGQLYQDGHGTLAYRDVWNLFDNLLVSQTLLGKDYSSWRILQDNSTKHGYYGHISRAPYLVQRSGQFKGYPFRTFSYGQFQNGYSDHFPVYIYLVRQMP